MKHQRPSSKLKLEPERKCQEPLGNCLSIRANIVTGGFERALWLSMMNFLIEQLLSSEVVSYCSITGTKSG